MFYLLQFGALTLSRVYFVEQLSVFQQKHWEINLYLWVTEFNRKALDLMEKVQIIFGVKSVVSTNQSWIIVSCGHLIL